MFHIYSIPFHIPANEFIFEEDQEAFTHAQFSCIGTDTFRRDIVFYFSLLLYLLKIKKIARHSFLYIPDGSSKKLFCCWLYSCCRRCFLSFVLLFIANTLSFFVDSRYNNVESKLTKRTKCVYTDKRLSDSIDTFVS